MSELVLTQEMLASAGPMSLSLRVSNLLLKAEAQIDWRIDGSTLVTSGRVSFKLPLRDAMSFEISGRDNVGEFAFEEFEYGDGAKYFGHWKAEAPRILSEDQRKKFVFELVEKPVMTAGGLLFCALRLPEGTWPAKYVGLDKVHKITLHREGSRIEILNDKPIASLFVEGTRFVGGEVYLPVVGKVSFRA